MNYLKQTLTENIPVNIFNNETGEIIETAESIAKALRKMGVYDKKSNVKLLSKKKNGQRRILYSSKLKLNIYLEYERSKIN